MTQFTALFVAITAILSYRLYSLYQTWKIPEFTLIPINMTGYSYCQAPLPTKQSTAQGSLDKLIIFHRHGDRSPIYHIQKYNAIWVTKTSFNHMMFAMVMLQRFCNLKMENQKH